jgi:hypothetical protein
MKRLTIPLLLIAGLGLIAGCGSGSPSRLDHETAAVQRLLAQESELDARSKKAGAEAHRDRALGERCLSTACMEAATTLLEGASDRIARETAEYKVLHRRINGYGSAAIRAAYRAAFAPKREQIERETEEAEAELEEAGR